MGLYQDLGCVSVPGEGSVTIPERLLQRAVASRVESLQVDALQLACVHPRTTSLPGEAMSSVLMWLSSKQSLHGGHACLLAPFQPLGPSPLLSPPFLPRAPLLMHPCSHPPLHPLFSSHPCEPSLCCLLKVACGLLARSPCQLFMHNNWFGDYAVQVVMDRAPSSKYRCLA